MRIPLILKRCFSLLLVLCVSIVLTGCFGRSNQDESQETVVAFDGLTLSIPETYQLVPSTIIENKQILNKVIKSFKLIEDEGYVDNIIITKSMITPTLSSEQFATANLEKLQENIIGFQAGEQTTYTISCGEEDIDLYRYSFRITDAFYNAAQQYYVDQVQFVYNKQGYILSFASDLSDKKITKGFTTIINSLECTPLQVELSPDV